MTYSIKIKETRFQLVLKNKKEGAKIILENIIKFFESIATPVSVIAAFFTTYIAKKGYDLSVEQKNLQRKERKENSKKLLKKIASDNKSYLNVILLLKSKSYSGPDEILNFSNDKNLPGLTKKFIERTEKFKEKYLMELTLEDVEKIEQSILNSKFILNETNTIIRSSENKVDKKELFEKVISRTNELLDIF